MNGPYLQIDGISKRFGGVQALDAVALEVHAGEVMGLIGENGAGKSTLVKILTGIYPPDAGTLRIGGTERVFAGPRDASLMGVSAIQQEPSMFDDLTVAENVFVAAQPGKGLAGPDRLAAHEPGSGPHPGRDRSCGGDLRTHAQSWGGRAAHGLARPSTCD